MDYSKYILEDAINEIGLGTSALIGAGLGAVVNTAAWARKRMQLRKRLQNCGRDYTCRAQVQEEIRNLNKSMMKRTAAAAGAGAGAGAVAKTGVVNSLNKVAAVSAPLMQTSMAVGTAAGLANQIKATAADNVTDARKDVLDSETKLNQIQAKSAEEIEKAEERVKEEKEETQRDREREARRNYTRSGETYRG